MSPAAACGGRPDINLCTLRADIRRVPSTGGPTAAGGGLPDITLGSVGTLPADAGWGPGGPALGFGWGPGGGSRGAGGNHPRHSAGWGPTPGFGREPVDGWGPCCGPAARGGMPDIILGTLRATPGVPLRLGARRRRAGGWRTYHPFTALLRLPHISCLFSKCRSHYAQSGFLVSHIRT